MYTLGSTAAGGSAGRGVGRAGLGRWPERDDSEGLSVGWITGAYPPSKMTESSGPEPGPGADDVRGAPGNPGAAWVRGDSGAFGQPGAPGLLEALGLPGVPGAPWPPWAPGLGA